jgi:hypothetical protein
MTDIDLDECHDVSGGFRLICEPWVPGPTFPGPILPDPRPMPLFGLAMTARMPICALID